MDTLRDLFRIYAPELLTDYSLEPTELQKEALQALDFYKNKRGWKKGIIVLPTGTGKTILSAIDALKTGKRILFLVHRLDILIQSIEAYKYVRPSINFGILTGEERKNECDCDVLFASKDSIRQPSELVRFQRDWFDYIIIDEVHHGQSPTYKNIITHFTPKFMLGLTATPDRTDRKDIFELFDYNKIYEISLVETIERGFLVPYTYYGLTDNVDYSNIRYENQRYRVEDLERLLIIPERNAAILKEYKEKGDFDKAIGFCVSITHAERMAEFFNQNDVTAAAIHFKSPTRSEDLEKFRENRIQIAFTVDMFNEGMDFPNVRVLLFLRPTESKTIFIQQLGRGLRRCIGKDRVKVLDFIGNYQRANQIRKYLSKNQNVKTVEIDGRRKKKIEYIYSNGCQVIFNTDVEEILNRQDEQEIDVTKEELVDSYYALAEILGRKPNCADIDQQGEYKSSVYVRFFGSWLKFLRENGEYTEASYHYPQGVHLGHILSILKVFGNSKNRNNTHFDDNYIRFRGNFGKGRIANYRRQIKYKLQAAMELGILVDDRNYASDELYSLELTPIGNNLYQALLPLLNRLDLNFKGMENDIPSTRMDAQDYYYNNEIRDFINTNHLAKEIVHKVFLNMHAVKQMLAFLYHIIRSNQVSRSQIYEQFFQTPFVKQYCDQEGIDEATDEGARRRCPFLLNILAACDVINVNNNQIQINKLVLMPFLVRPYKHEKFEISNARLNMLIVSLSEKSKSINSEDLSILKELFGSTFLTNSYHLTEYLVIRE